MKKTRVMPRTPSAKKTAFIGSGILAVSSSQTETNQVNAHGIFTAYHVWAFPSYRPSVAVVTVFGLKRGTTSLDFRLQGPRGKPRPMFRLDLKRQSKDPIGTTSRTTVNFELKEPGLHELCVKIAGRRAALRIPFLVIQKDWPCLSKKEQAFAAKDPGLLGGVRLSVECPSCSALYTFEDSFEEKASPSGDTRPFPESGEFQCEKCGKKKLYLRDLQGQLRSTLKQKIALAMSGVR